MLTFPRLYVAIVILVVRAVRVLARSRADLVLENRGKSRRTTPISDWAREQGGGACAVHGGRPR